MAIWVWIAGLSKPGNQIGPILLGNAVYVGIARAAMMRPLARMEPAREEPRRAAA